MHFPTIVVGSLLTVALALPTNTITSFEKREIAERDLAGDVTKLLDQALQLLQGGAGAGAAAPAAGAAAEEAKKAEEAAKAAEDTKKKEEAAKAAEEAAKAGGAAKGNATEPVEAIKEGEAAAENEVELEGKFDEAVALGGDDVKTDVVFPPEPVGKFEVEFQAATGTDLTVVQNAAPAGTAPAGFKFLDPKSYQVTLAAGATGITLQKIDYILDVTNAEVIAAGNLATGRVGKLEGAAFVVDNVGDLEFELEENELTLTVADLNGEFALFVPDGTVEVAPAKIAVEEEEAAAEPAKLAGEAAKNATEPAKAAEPAKVAEPVKAEPAKAEPAKAAEHAAQPVKAAENVKLGAADVSTLPEPVKAALLAAGIVAKS